MRQGFSLVELSIVLVILGLLTGGILGGQALIRAAELRTISTEYTRFFTATQTFRDKYFALPGDMTNATAFWGTQDPTPATCATTPSSSALTCNGNGNGVITAVSAGSNELFRYWQHLANAGLIEGSYTGTSVPPSPAGYGSVRGTNIPISKVTNAALWSFSNYNVGTQMYPQPDGNSFFLGQAGGLGFGSGAIIRVEEQWNIDTKMDDGRPGLGNVRAWLSNINPGCTTSDTADSAEYALNATGTRCSLIFRGAI